MTDFTRIARKITFILFIAQSLASAGFIAVATLNSIIGAQLGGSSGWAGVPSAVYLIGGALAASMWGVLMDRFGRRNGIAFGLLLGVLGSTLVVIAIDARALVLFLIGMVLGLGGATMLVAEDRPSKTTSTCWMSMPSCWAYSYIHRSASWG